MASKPPSATEAQVEHENLVLMLSCNDEYIVIKFDDHGERSL